MKLNRLETHDRFQHLIKQDFDIGKCCEDLLNKRPFGNNPFYIFAHARTAEDGVTKILIWQPRLTKPRSQSNSMLFKAYPGTDNIRVIWIIPDKALWNQYIKGNVTENPLVQESIHNYIHKRQDLDKKEEGDLNDHQIDMIYRQISGTSKYKMV